MKIVFLIASSGGFKYKAISLGQSITWLRDRPKDVLAFRIIGNGKLGKGAPTRFDLHNPHTYGNSPLLHLNNVEVNQKHLLMVDSTSGWDQILTNSMSAFDWVDKNLDYDFVIRTNISTYWNIPVLVDLLGRLKKPRLYAGNVANNLGQVYVEGDGIIFSRDTVKLLLNNFDKIDSSIIDDVSIGMTLKELQVTPTHIPRPWIRKFKQTRSVDIFKESYSIRCKAEYKKGIFTVRIDPLIMKIIHNRILRFSEKKI
jgi:hypothetical protein